MKKIFILAFSILIAFSSSAQVFENKTNIYFGYSKGFFVGNEMYRNGDFITPSLYKQYTNKFGLFAKALTKVNKSYRLGFVVDYIENGYENRINQLEYNTSTNSILTLGPTIQFHSKYVKHGVLNRIKLIAEVSPVAGISNVQISDSPFEVYDYHGLSQEITLNTTNAFVGLKANAGFEYSISNKVGLSFNYSIQHSFISSKLYFDKSFTYSHLAFGLIYKLSIEKRIYKL